MHGAVQVHEIQTYAPRRHWSCRRGPERRRRRRARWSKTSRTRRRTTRWSSTCSPRPLYPLDSGRQVDSKQRNEMLEVILLSWRTYFDQSRMQVEVMRHDDSSDNRDPLKELRRTATATPRHHHTGEELALNTFRNRSLSGNAVQRLRWMSNLQRNFYFIYRTTVFV